VVSAVRGWVGRSIGDGPPDAFVSGLARASLVRATRGPTTASLGGLQRQCGEVPLAGMRSASGTLGLTQLAVGIDLAIEPIEEARRAGAVCAAGSSTREWSA